MKNKQWGFCICITSAMCRLRDTQPIQAGCSKKWPRQICKYIPPHVKLLIARGRRSAIVALFASRTKSFVREKILCCNRMRDRPAWHGWRWCTGGIVFGTNRHLRVAISSRHRQDFPKRSKLFHSYIEFEINKDSSQAILKLNNSIETLNYQFSVRSILASKLTPIC